MNRDELRQAVRTGYEKQSGVWSRMDSAERELVIIVAMIVCVLSGLLLWIIF